MKTPCRPLSVLLAATLALMSACAVPVSLPPPAAAPTSPPVVKQLETLAPTAVPQPAVAPVVAPTAAPPVLAPTAVPPSATPAAPPKLAEPQPLIAPDQMRFEGKVDIGGRSLFLSCAGKGEPTIIVDDIMGRNGSNFIAPYQPELSQISRVCFVSRPNTIDSQSDSVKEMRTITDLVSDLRAVLQKAGLKPPYVLAGGEFGAMNMTLFAAQYPKEVVGLALVQPWRPGTTSAFLDLVPAASATSDKAKQLRAFWEGMLVGKYKDPSIELDTRIDIVASEKLLLGVKSLGDMPVYVLRGAPQAWALAPEPAIAAQMNKIYDERLEFYAKLSNRVELTEGRFVDKAPFLAAVQKLVDAARAQKANEQAAASTRQSTPEIVASKPLIPPEATSFDGMIDIGGHSLYLNCMGKGSPTIVFDAGILTRGSVLFNAFDFKFPEGTRVCVYDRPNVIGSYSDPVYGKTSSQKIVNDLRALLTKAGLKPPYVLIGHSLGGMNMTLFAAQHQADVGGLILLDPLPPGTFEEWMKLLKTETYSGQPATFAGPLAELAHGSYENIDIEDSSAALEASKPLSSIPVTLVAAQRPLGGGWTSIMDAAFEAKLIEAWKTRRAYFSRIAPKIEVIEVNESHLLNGDASNAAVSKALAKMTEWARSIPTPAR